MSNPKDGWLGARTIRVLVMGAWLVGLISLVSMCAGMTLAAPSAVGGLHQGPARPALGTLLVRAG